MTKYLEELRYQQTPQVGASLYDDDEIDLRELFAIVWQGKWIILLTTLLFAVAGLVYALNKPNIYQADVLLAPQNSEEGGGLSRLAGQFGGLASLAGVNLGTDGASKTAIALEVLKSRAFLSEFIREHKLEVPLMAATGWNAEANSLVYNTVIYDPERGDWKTDEKGKTFAPTDWDLVKAFKSDVLSVREAKDTGMVTLSIKHLSPVLAQEWAHALVTAINQTMRETDVSESQARIEFLQGKLKETNVAGMQQVFFQLIESETRTVMLANAQTEYVFKTVDPAVVPQEKSEPKRALIVVLAIMLGGMFGLFLVAIRAFIRGSKDDRKIAHDSGNELSKAPTVAHAV